MIEYKVLNKKEMESVVNKYLKHYPDKIYKITSITYNGVIEYGINDCEYMFWVSE